MTAPRRFPPPSQASEPGFLLALRPEVVAALVQRHLTEAATLLDLQPDYVRWKDNDGSVLGFHATVQFSGGIARTYVVARTAALVRLADEAERLHHRADEHHAGLRSFAFVPSAQMLLLAFPFDRQMHDLRRIVRASKVRSFVTDHCPSLVPAGQRFSKSRSAWHLVSYRPERRAVVRWRIGLAAPHGSVAVEPTLWIRCHAEPLASRAAAATTAAAAGGLRCPRTLGIAHERLAFESHVDGRDWSPFLRLEDRDMGFAARATAALHRIPAPSGLPIHHALAELDLVLQAAEDLARLDARLGSFSRSVADRLAALVPPSRDVVLAHGDLHPGQVMLGDDDAGLVDFDRACAAPAALDLATFFAQCTERDPRLGARVGRAFVAAYARHGSAPDTDELVWWSACALVRNATRPFRRLATEWRAQGAALLGRADAMLKRPDAAEAWS